MERIEGAKDGREVGMGAFEGGLVEDQGLDGLEKGFAGLDVDERSI